MVEIKAKPKVDACKYAPPTYGRTVTLPSVEALHEYLKLHEQTHEVLGWRGNVLVLRKTLDSRQEEHTVTPEKEEQA
jgi:hypothetical protein